MSSPDQLPCPWWLIPNLIALDAPAVAVVWQRFFAGCFGVVVPWAATAALAATVWCVYLTDRWLDGRRGMIGADRHRVAGRYGGAIFVGSIAAAGVAGLAATLLPLAYVDWGLHLALGVALYLVLVHTASRWLQPVTGAKEFLVAAGFACGVAIPLRIDGGDYTGWLPSVLAFGGLCWVNCRLIECWETESASRRLNGLVIGSMAIIVIGLASLPLGVGIAVAASALGLVLVHLGCRGRPRPARVLADAVLLSPVVWWFL